MIVYLWVLLRAAEKTHLSLLIRSISRRIFGMTFHIIAPKGSFPTTSFRLIFSQLPLSLITFLNNSVLDWTRWGSTFAFAFSCSLCTIDLFVAT